MNFSPSDQIPGYLSKILKRKIGEFKFNLLKDPLRKYNQTKNKKES